MYEPATFQCMRLAGIVLLAATVSSVLGQDESPNSLDVSVSHTQIIGGDPLGRGAPPSICFELTITNRTNESITYEGSSISLQIDGQRQSPFTGQAGASRLNAEGRPRLPLLVEIPRKDRFPSTRRLDQLSHLGAGTLASNKQVSGWLAYELPPVDDSAPAGAKPLVRECLLLIPVGSEVQRLDLLQTELEHGIKTRRCVFDESIPVVEIGSRINALNVHRLIEVYESMQKGDEDFVILFTSEDLLIDSQVTFRLRSVRPTMDWVRKHAFWTNIPSRLFSHVHASLVGGLFGSAHSEVAAMAYILGRRENGHELLIHKLLDSSAEVREVAARQLSQLCNSPGVVESLEKSVADEEPAVRAAALYSLAAYYRGPKGPTSEDAEMVAPQELKDDKLQQILEVTADPAAEVRAATMHLLGVCRDPRAEAAVVDAASDSDTTVRRAAVGALRNSRNSRAADIILEALKDPDTRIRHTAIASSAGHPAATFGPAITECLDHENESLVTTACRTLGELKFQPAAPKLRELLRHENISVARAAADALEDLGALTDADAWLLQREQGVILKPIPHAAAINKLLKPEQLAVSEAVTNSIGMVLVPIPAGEFQMGSPDENNQHRVQITESYYMGAFEVTQEQFSKVMGPLRGSSAVFPGPSGGPYKPVFMISHDHATTFCQRLSQLPEEKSANRQYRLPTEAEWEYACRAGTTTSYSFGDDSTQLNVHAWYGDNSGRQIHSVGQKHPNPWALYDMHGNVAEWCRDWFGDYPSAPMTIDPAGPEEGSGRVYRGGAWPDSANSCTSAARNGMPPTFLGDTRGFRVVMILPEGEPGSPKH